jgi:CBS domain-containing protein
LDEYSGENSTDLSSIFFDYEITFGEQRIEDAIGNVVLKCKKTTRYSLTFGQ